MHRCRLLLAAAGSLPLAQSLVGPAFSMQDQGPVVILGAQDGTAAAGSAFDASRFGPPAEPGDAIGPPPVRIMKPRDVTPKAPKDTPHAGQPKEGVDPSRFGGRLPDQAYGAYQRGLYKTAYNLALPRAENGDAAAQTLVAELLSRGLGMRRNDRDAAQWYQRAAEQGVPEAQFQYALMLIDGKYVKKDIKEAYALMQAAAEAGNPLAQFNLAQMIVNHQAGGESIIKAADYYRRAAEAGVPDAQYAMAQIALNGIGDRKADPAEGVRWLTLAARQNYDTAQLDLGTLLVEGRFVKRDEKAGFRWLKRAADSGNVAAQNRLAKLYMNGLGTEPDNIEAAAWYIVARRAGLVDPVMDDFMAGLTDEEQKTALERANRLR